MISLTENNQMNYFTFEENIAYKQLPFELYELILSSLRNDEAMKACSINRFWKVKTIHVIKTRELIKIDVFARLLGNYLKDQTSLNHKQTLSKFISVEQYGNPIGIDLIEKKKNELKNILLSLSEKDLDQFFDGFTSKKPRLFYEFVNLSKKYSKLHERLNFGLRLNLDADVKDLLSRGAIPTRSTLDLVLQKPSIFSDIARASGETIELLLETGAVIPSTGHLNIAINKNSTPILLAMLDAGAILKEEHLNLAIEKNYAPIIRTLLKRGLTPTCFQMDLAEKNSSFEAIMMLLRAGVPPSTNTFKVIEQSKIALAKDGSLAEFNKLLKPYGQLPIIVEPASEATSPIIRWLLSPIDHLFDF